MWGTGLGPRDNTPEATRNVLEKEAIGISEALRMHGQKRTPLSMLSRGAAGVRGKTVIVNLPGSVKAVSESLDASDPRHTARIEDAGRSRTLAMKFPLFLSHPCSLG